MSGKEKAGRSLGFQGVRELGWRTIVVFHRIAGAHDLRAFEAGNGANEGVLHFQRKARGDTVDVIFFGVAPLGFEEYLMCRTLGKFHDFVFDRRAVARPDAFDPAGVQRRLVEIGADQLVRFLVRVGRPAGQLFHVERSCGPVIQRENIVTLTEQALGNE